jgi:predicted esterase
MGGFGAWRLGLLQPERFAGLIVLSGPLTHGGEDVASGLESVEDLPFFVAHGTGDTACSVEHARRAVNILLGREYPLLMYHEIEGAGHGGYAGQLMPTVLEWLRAREADAISGQRE